MNVFIMLTALKNALAPSLASLPLETRKRDKAGEPEIAPAKIFIGQLPPKNAQACYEAPFVLIQPLHGHGQDGSHRVELAIRVLIFNAEPEAAEEDLHNLISVIRRRLMEFRGAPLEDQFVLEAQDGDEILPWTRPDEQSAQFLEAFIISSWRLPGWE